MNDILPDRTPYWRYLESSFQSVVSAYGYHEVRLPLVEFTHLFSRTIGEETDIVAKEMYTFEDRNGDSLTLRPEGTAGCVRMGIQHHLFRHQIQRFWYLGPMFRHERPQKGRYRQFFQCGVEAFGSQNAAMDAEIIALSYRFWQTLQLDSFFHLQLNNLGTPAARMKYRQKLIDYFCRYESELDKESQHRLYTNPLRLLDSKNPRLVDLIATAPRLEDDLETDSKRYFDELEQHLSRLKIPYVINPHLVRGLDYYGLTVFEWVTDSLGTQGTVCAGGRYDNLIQQLGGPPTPAVGFAMGLERLVLCLEKIRYCAFSPTLYFILIGQEALQKGLLWAEKVRDEIKGVSIEIDVSNGSVKSQFKHANKSGARWACIIAEEELANNTLSVKDLRQQQGQQMMSIEQLLSFIKDQIDIPKTSDF